MINTDKLEIFGIPKWLVTSNKPGVENIVEKVNYLVVEKENNQSFLKEGATKTLLFKMLGAIQLTQNQIKCIAVKDDADLAQQLNKFDAKIVLLMGDFKPLKNTFITNHPSEVLQNPALKRIAWEVLKNIKNA